MFTKPASLLALALLLIALLAGCSPAPAVITASTQPAAACPQPADGQALLTNTVAGYCVLYPDSYLVHQADETPESNSTVLYLESLLNTSAPRLDVTVRPAAGQDLDAVAQAFFEENPTLVLPPPESLTLGGEPALLFPQVPGQELNRVLFAVHAGRVYRLNFSPADDSLGQVYQDLQVLFDSVAGSFTFLE